MLRFLLSLVRIFQLLLHFSILVRLILHYSPCISLNEPHATTIGTRTITEHGISVGICSGLHEGVNFLVSVRSGCMAEGRALN